MTDLKEEVPQKEEVLTIDRKEKVIHQNLKGRQQDQVAQQVVHTGTDLQEVQGLQVHTKATVREDQVVQPLVLGVRAVLQDQEAILLREAVEAVLQDQEVILLQEVVEAVLVLQDQVLASLALQVLVREVAQEVAQEVVQVEKDSFFSNFQKQ